MAKFSWEGTTRAGEKRRGVMEADSRDMVEERLRGDGVTIGKVRKKAGSATSIFRSAPVSTPRICRSSRGSSRR